MGTFRQSRKTPRQRRKHNMTKEGLAATRDSRFTPLDDRIILIPIRPDVTVKVFMPEPITKAEAEKIAAIIEAHAK